MSASATDVGFVFQCALCGSYAIFAVDALDPAEVERRASGVAAAAGHHHKILQKDVHAVQDELLELIQRRLAPSTQAEKSAASQSTHSSGRFSLLPCAACIEISTGRKFAEWLDDRESLEQPTICCPQLVVIFEADALPPAYVDRSGKWCLAQGVGPKDLEVKKPNQLPAGQFRTLLPPMAPPMRPPCWQKAGMEESEPPEAWSGREALIEAVTGLADLEPREPGDDAGAVANTRAAHGSNKRETASSTGKRGQARARPELVQRAPPIGALCPWLEDLCDTAVEVWIGMQQSQGRSQRRERQTTGARYISVPLMRATDDVRFLADMKLQALGG